MPTWITALFDIIDRIAQYFANQQLIDAGKAEQKVQVQQEVEEHVQQATEAVTVPDATRTERLRSRFDSAS